MNSSTSNRPFFSCTENPCTCNLFKIFKLDITSAPWGSLPLGDKDEENMTIVLFFSLSPVANCSCECDGKSYKLE